MASKNSKHRTPQPSAADLARQVGRYARLLEELLQSQDARIAPRDRRSLAAFLRQIGRALRGWTARLAKDPATDPRTFYRGAVAWSIERLAEVQGDLEQLGETVNDLLAERDELREQLGAFLGEALDDNHDPDGA